MCGVAVLCCKESCYYEDLPGMHKVTTIEADSCA